MANGPSNKESKSIQIVSFDGEGVRVVAAEESFTIVKF